MNIKEIVKHERTIKFIVSLLIILFLLKFINIPLFLNSLKSVNNLFLVVLALIPINILLRAWRLSIIINHNEKLISLKHSFYLNLAGITLNLFLPASSGDIAKSYYGYKWHGIKEEMLSANIFDKFMALFSVFIIGFFASLFMKFYVISILAAILSLVFGITFFYPHRLPWNILNKILFKIFKINLDKDKLVFSFAVSSKIKLKTFLLSIFTWIILYFQFYVLCLSFSVNVSLIYVLAISPIMSLANLFPLTLNGLGSGEAVLIYLFSLINISPTMALLVSLMSQVVNAIIPALFGFIIIIKNR